MAAASVEADDAAWEAGEFMTELRKLQGLTHVDEAIVRRLCQLAFKNAKAHYKRIVHSLEKFIAKAAPECRLCPLYVIDLICRSAIKYKDKKMLVARFSLHLEKTIKYAVEGNTKQQKAVQRLLHLWEKNALFDPDTIDNCKKVLKKKLGSRYSEVSASPTAAEKSILENYERMSPQESGRTSPVPGSVGANGQIMTAAPTRGGGAAGPVPSAGAGAGTAPAVDARVNELVARLVGQGGGHAAQGGGMNPLTSLLTMAAKQQQASTQQGMPRPIMPGMHPMQFQQMQHMQQMQQQMHQQQPPQQAEPPPMSFDYDDDNENDADRIKRLEMQRKAEQERLAAAQSGGSSAPPPSDITSTSTAGPGAHGGFPQPVHHGAPPHGYPQHGGMQQHGGMPPQQQGIKRGREDNEGESPSKRSRFDQGPPSGGAGAGAPYPQGGYPQQGQPQQGPPQGGPPQSIGRGAPMPAWMAEQQRGRGGGGAWPDARGRGMPPGPPQGWQGRGGMPPFPPPPGGFQGAPQGGYPPQQQGGQQGGYGGGPPSGGQQGQWDRSREDRR